MWLHFSVHELIKETLVKIGTITLVIIASLFTGFAFDSCVMHGPVVGNQFLILDKDNNVLGCKSVIEETRFMATIFLPLVECKSNKTNVIIYEDKEQ